jgi:palmitoyltransferase ZDHHC1/11
MVMEDFTFRKRKRTNGFEWPWHPGQAVSILLYAISFVAHILFVLSFVQEIEIRNFVLFLSAGLSLIVFSSWFIASTIDPEINSCKTQQPDKSMPLWCGRKAPRVSRLCFECRKTVFEFDHHCSFINNCVGTKNYSSFIILIVSGSVQLLLHAVVSLLIEAYFVDKDDLSSDFDTAAFFVFINIQFLVSFITSL